MKETQFDRLAGVVAQEPTGRRRLVGGLLGRAVTIVLASRGGSSAAAQATTPMAGNIPPALQEWAAAWSAHDDGVRLAALYTSDATHEEVPSGTIFHGPELRRKMIITVLVLAIYRIGYLVPMPVVDEFRMA